MHGFAYHLLYITTKIYLSASSSVFAFVLSEEIGRLKAGATQPAA